MEARLTVQEAFGQIFQDEEADNDLEEDVSKQEDNMEENSDYSPSDQDDSDGEEQAPRETFMSKNNAISWSSLQFDNRETRTAQRVTDKLAAIRDVWDKWMERLPLMNNPGPEVTVDERLVPFRGKNCLLLLD